jgi:hypothetical protein
MSKVFISYSRPDDACFGKSTRGWVTSFADNLEKLLRQQPGGRGYSVWIDHALPPEKSLSPGLSAELGQAAALLAMLSPGYLDSDWCPGELTHFLGRFEGRTDERVFLAEYMPIVRDRLPEGVRGLVPLAFWEKSIDKLAPMTLGFPQPDDSDRLYWNLLRELAHAIGGRLARDAGSAVSQPVRKVWIATPTDDLRSQVLDLAGFLRQQGCEVIDTEDATYTKRGADAEAELRSALAGADVLLQCFGQHAGRVFGDLNESVTALQCRVAKSVTAAAGKPFLTWRAPELALDSIADEAYRAVLTGGIACGFEEFKRQVLAALQRDEAPPPDSAAQVAKPADAGPMICVSADVVDQPLGKQVLGLLKSLGADAMLMPEPGRQLKLNQWSSHYEDTLTASDGLLVVYGRTKPTWVQSRLAASRRMIASRRAATLPGLLDAPPPGKPELGMQLRNLSLLDCRDGLKPEPLQQFLQQVRSSATGAAHA